MCINSRCFVSPCFDSVQLSFGNGLESKGIYHSRTCLLQLVGAFPARFVAVAIGRSLSSTIRWEVCSLRWVGDITFSVKIIHTRRAQTFAHSDKPTQCLPKRTSRANALLTIAKGVSQANTTGHSEQVSRVVSGGVEVRAPMPVTHAPVGPCVFQSFSSNTFMKAMCKSGRGDV